MSGLRLAAGAVAGFLIGCAPAEDPLCGNPASLIETITVTEDMDEARRTTRREGTLVTSGGRRTDRLVIRVDALDGRLLAYDESPPTSGAPPNAASRSVVVAYDDADRPTSVTILDLDGRTNPVGTWQVAIERDEAGEPVRVEAAGTPVPSDALRQAIGTIEPGPSAGEVAWMPPLPGADLMGPLPADVDALMRARAPGAPIAFVAEYAAIEDDTGGRRATWTFGGDDVSLQSTVEHVDTEDGWVRTWPGEGGLQTVRLEYVRGQRDGDFALDFLLDGAVYESHRALTDTIAGGERRTYTVRSGDRLAYLEETDRFGDTTEVRVDANGDGDFDEIRLQQPVGEGRTLDIIDIAPFGAIELYRFTEIEDGVTTVQSVSPDAGKQLCATGGGAVVLEGEPGARTVLGVPEGLPAPPPAP